MMPPKSPKENVQVKLNVPGINLPPLPPPTGHAFPDKPLTGTSNNGVGVEGDSTNSFGVQGQGGPIGVAGFGDIGVLGQCNTETGHGVVGFTQGTGNGLVGASTKGFGLFAQGFNAPAAHFEGHVEINGDIKAVNNITVKTDITLTGADCAEQFDLTEERQLEPGTVVVITQDGSLKESCNPYDRKVAGVVSGAGDYSPGIVLDKRPSDGKRVSVALIGKVYCKVDAQYGAVEVGDLLTASPRPGYAMKASDPTLAFGAVIGKALAAMPTGSGLVPVLVALQ